MYTGRIVFRIISGLVILGLLILGGVALYNAGWSQGAGTASLAASATSVASGGQVVQPVPGAIFPYAYGYPFFRPWFFGPWACLFPFLGILAFFFLMRLLFFPFFGWGRHRRWMMEGHPGWRGWHEEQNKPEEEKGGTSQGTSS